MPNRPSRLEVGIPTASFDGKYYGRYPHGTAPNAVLAGDAVAAATVAGSIITGSKLLGAAPVSSAVSAALSTRIKLAGAPADASSASGTLFGTGLSAPLVQASDITYQGSFLIPNTIGGVDYTFGGGALGMGPPNAGKSTLIVSAGVGGGNWDKLVQVNIPTPSVSTPPTATSVGTPGSVGVTFSVTSGVQQQLTGSLYWAPTGKTIISGMGSFSNTSDDRQTFVSCNTPFSSFNAPQKAVGGASIRLGAGAMSPFPPEWAALFGKPAYIATGPHSIDANCENGPGLYGFDPADVDGSGDVTTVPYLAYPYTGLGKWRTGTGSQAGTSFFTEVHQVVACAVVPNTRSAIFIGCRAMGTGCDYYTTDPVDNQGNVNTGPLQCYGASSGNGGACVDPCRTDGKGPHGYPYRLNIWAYDLADLYNVKQGLTTSYFPLPYLDQGVPGSLGSNGCFDLYYTSGCYDPVASVLYLSENKNPTIIHCFHIAHP